MNFDPTIGHNDQVQKLKALMSTCKVGFVGSCSSRGFWETPNSGTPEFPIYGTPREIDSMSFRIYDVYYPGNSELRNLGYADLKFPQGNGGKFGPVHYVVMPCYPGNPPTLTQNSTYTQNLPGPASACPWFTSKFNLDTYDDVKLVALSRYAGQGEIYDFAKDLWKEADKDYIDKIGYLDKGTICNPASKDVFKTIADFIVNDANKNLNDPERYFPTVMNEQEFNPFV